MCSIFLVLNSKAKNTLILTFSQQNFQLTTTLLNFLTKTRHRLNPLIISIQHLLNNYSFIEINRIKKQTIFQLFLERLLFVLKDLASLFLLAELNAEEEVVHV